VYYFYSNKKVIQAEDESFLKECDNFNNQELLKLKKEKKSLLKKIKELNVEIKLLKLNYTSLENLFNTQIISI
jgi:hypothetical protein